MGKTYAVGDLHGRFDVLLESIRLIEEDAGDAGGTFYILGDMIDRGPQSSQIIAHLMTGPTKPNWVWRTLKGNHESMMLMCLMDTRHLKWWLKSGGNTTLKSYGYEDGDALQPLRIPIEHLIWVNALPSYFEDEYRIYVHAGVPFDIPVKDADDGDLQWMRHNTFNETTTIKGGFYFDKPHISGKHIVHGHTKGAEHPLLLNHRTNLDSFAWNTGFMGVAVFDDMIPGGPVKILHAQCAPHS